LDFSNIRVDKDIRVSEVRVIDETGRQVGIVPTFEARRYAESVGLNLVEINPKVRPPICKVMDFGKYKFDTQKKEKEDKAKSKSNQSKTKEIKFHPNTQTHDYTYRLEQAKKFLAEGSKVKASVFFRGREMNYMDRGQTILETMKKDLEGLAIVEFSNREDRSLITLFRPV